MTLTLNNARQAFSEFPSHWAYLFFPHDYNEAINSGGANRRGDCLCHVLIPRGYAITCYLWWSPRSLPGLSIGKSLPFPFLRGGQSSFPFWKEECWRVYGHLWKLTQKLVSIWGRYCEAVNTLLLRQLLILPAAIIPVMWSWCFLFPSVLQLLTRIILYDVPPLPFYSFVRSFIYISMNSLLFTFSFGA